MPADLSAASAAAVEAQEVLETALEQRRLLEIGAGANAASRHSMPLDERSLGALATGGEEALREAASKALSEKNAAIQMERDKAETARRGPSRRGHGGFPIAPT